MSVNHSDILLKSCVDWFEKEYPEELLINFILFDKQVLFLVKPKLVWRSPLSIDLWNHGLFLLPTTENVEKNEKLIKFRNVLTDNRYVFNQFNSFDEFTNIINGYLITN